MRAIYEKIKGLYIKIKGTEEYGQIIIEDDCVYVCTNNAQYIGARARRIPEQYLYSWSLGYDIKTMKDLEESLHCLSLRLVDINVLKIGEM